MAATPVDRQPPTTLGSLSLLAGALGQAQTEVSQLLQQRHTLAQEARAEGCTVAEVADAMRVSRPQAYVIVRDRVTSASGGARRRTAGAGHGPCDTETGHE